MVGLCIQRHSPQCVALLYPNSSCQLPVRSGAGKSFFIFHSSETVGTFLSGSCDSGMHIGPTYFSLPSWWSCDPAFVVSTIATIGTTAPGLNLAVLLRQRLVRSSDKRNISFNPCGSPSIASYLAMVSLFAVTYSSGSSSAWSSAPQGVKACPISNRALYPALA